MDLPEEIDNEVKKAEKSIYKKELDGQVRTLGLEMDRTGHALSEEIRDAKDTRPGKKAE